MLSCWYSGTRTWCCAATSARYSRNLYLFVTSDERQIWRRAGLLMRRVASLDLSEVQEMRRFDPVIGVNREIDGLANAAAYGRGG
jgi:hypothetical protein